MPGTLVTLTDNVTPVRETIPMTTLFAPPRSCASLWTYERQYYNSIINGILIQNALSQSMDTQCYPTGYDNFARVNSKALYSPGACPIGYVTPVSSQNNGNTTAVCCTNGFTYFTQTTTPNYITGATPTEFAGCLSLFPSGSVTAVPARDGNTDLTSITVEGPLTMWAQPITVIYRKEDAPLFALPTAMNIATTPGPTPSSISPPSTSQDTTTPQPSKSLSGSMISAVGIGIGIGAFLLLAGFFIFMWRRYRAKRRRIDRHEDSEDLSVMATSETGLNFIVSKHEKLPLPVEAPIRSPVEVYTSPRMPAELYSSPGLHGERRYELDA